MTIAPEFELESTALGTGISLLEASAGTGKTYTISGIVARLVAVEGLAISEVLVVTFTEAATRELRERIRRRLQAIDRELCADTTTDPVTRALRASGLPLATVQQRLRLAVTAFDEAAISTIHGFCQQVLHDNAFEGDMPFDVEVLTDPSGLYIDLAHDFWRRNLLGGDPVALALASRDSLLPVGLANLLKSVLSHHDLIVLPVSKKGLDIASRELSHVAREALASWRTNGTRLTELLCTHKALSRGKLPADEAAQICAALDDAVTTAIVTPATIASLHKLSAESIEGFRDKRLKKNRYPDDAFHDICSGFVRASLEWISAVRADWLRFASDELPRTKAARNVMTFDDMLSQTDGALRGPTGNSLVNALRRRFRAALIDEFQDTDPLQYRIFHRCFAEAPHRLMLIGDPKQSIYGFRGADLFTYLRARDNVIDGASQYYTLRHNHRSVAPLVEGVNALFSLRSDCFVQSGLEFAAAIPADGTTTKGALRDLRTPNVPPLQLRHVPADAEGSLPVTKRARDIIARDIATEILILQSGDYRLGERNLEAGDIAILVRTHREAIAIQEVLRDAGITSVRRTDGSVFHTSEAEELVALLAGLLDPSRERLLKSALATSIFALKATELLALDDDDAKRGEWIRDFATIREHWQQRGFAAGFRKLLDRFGIRERLLGQRGGERKLTNFLHLAELAHRAERDERLAPSSLVRWISAQQRTLTTPADDHVQRLERDENAVRIVTVHNAKGLQYPVVFCPSHWASATDRETLFHDPTNDHRLTLDLSSPVPDSHRLASERERLAEDVRLLYVSLTRASHRCYLYLNGAKTKGVSPLTQVMGDDPVEAGRALADSLPTLFSLNKVRTSGALHVRAERQAQAVPMARSTSRMLGADSLVGSFSRLIAHADNDEVAQDYDVLETERTSTDVDVSNDVARGGPAPIFRLPAGAATGIALHAVLENVDFTQPQKIASLVSQYFSSLGLTEELLSATTRQLESLLNHPLSADDRTVVLNQIGLSDRRSEMEFYYPIRRFTPTELAAACKREGDVSFPERIGRLRFEPIDGFMRGFIDLVFRHDGRYYLADWKSNLLGNSTADYTPQRLAPVMREHFYDLQSWLYTVALDRHLAGRLENYRYEEHFGGIFYIFVRGLEASAPERGVHFERPSRAFVDRLSGVLFGQTGRVK